LGVLAGLFALLGGRVPSALAADFILDWSQIGFVEGTSSLQTFTNVSNSGVDVTTEVRVLDATFQDIGIYIPGTSSFNNGMPKTVGDALAVRDISETDYPGGDVGYVLTKITFSQSVMLNDLWMEAFFNWTDGGVRKHLALQAFDEDGNGVVPVDWTIYGASDLIVEAHPANGEPWLRSSYPNDQTIFSGASGIDYGDQAIRELYWYSWGFAADDSMSNLLGSTYLGSFQFSLEPTAITLVSADVAANSSALGAISLAVLLVSLATLIIVRRRLFKAS
jgi:hypothetical protein